MIKSKFWNKIKLHIHKHNNKYTVLDTSIDDDIYTKNNDVYRYAVDKTMKEILQASEGMYHNLNSLQLNLAA